MTTTPTHAQFAERCAELLALADRAAQSEWPLPRIAAMVCAGIRENGGAGKATDAVLADAAFLQSVHRQAQCIRELLEALREAERDARRYQWLRDKWHGFQYYKATIGGINFASLDRDIDAALNPEAKT